MYPHIPVVTHARPDPGLVRWVKWLAMLGLAVVLLFPAARGHGYWLGWAPLWLVGMPFVAWWALHRFRLPWNTGLSGMRKGAGRRGRPRFRAQARRCGKPLQYRQGRAA